MNILGLSFSYHDSAACLLVDGNVSAAVAQERFSRIKHDNGFPQSAAEYCLASSGKTIYDVDKIVFYEKPIFKFERVLFTHLKYFPRSLPSFLKFFPKWLNQNLLVPFQIRNNLSESIPVYYVGHHESHAASAFYPSPFEESLIITADGVGEWATTSWGIGRGHKIEMRQEIKFPHSIGLLYSAITTFLGFYANGGEGKVMGLAGYGKPEYIDQFKEIIQVFDDGSFRLNMTYFSYTYDISMYSKKMVDLLGDPRTPESELNERHYNIAATLQWILEDVMIKTTRNLIKKTSINNLCLAGGVALNCVANGKLLENTDVKNIFVQPAPGDDGGSLGSSLFLYHQILDQKKRTPLKQPFFGSEYSNTYIESLLKRQGEEISWTKMDSSLLLEKTAKTIANNKVIGWFQGKMEFGPRALGNRSILANPQNPEMKDILNKRIKKRESFRPFAPAILIESTEDYFNLSRPSPYMLITTSLKEGKEAVVPAICHVDNTARVQTVSCEDNPRFYDLIKNFERITGIPLILNTSFNLRGEPMVCSPEDALKCFLRSEMDYLVMGDFWVNKNDQDK